MPRRCLPRAAHDGNPFRAWPSMPLDKTGPLRFARVVTVAPVRRSLPATSISVPHAATAIVAFHAPAPPPSVVRHRVPWAMNTFARQPIVANSTSPKPEPIHRAKAALSPAPPPATLRHPGRSSPTKPDGAITFPDPLRPFSPLALVACGMRMSPTTSIGLRECEHIGSTPTAPPFQKSSRTRPQRPVRVGMPAPIGTADLTIIGQGGHRCGARAPSPPREKRGTHALPPH